ncbi:MAG: hypothetical protein ABR936_17415 [Bacteroidota bacterium]|jgi:hypothetical protein
MQTNLVEVEAKEKSTHEPKPGEIVDKLDFIEKEVDMGFFNQHSFEVKDGIVVNMSCQRIKKCSCNCNDCFISGNI